MGEVLASDLAGPRIGVVGLGAGVLAAYAREGQQWTFFELDPKVIEIAQKHFTFLERAQVRSELIEGDGRLTLSKQPDGAFDTLVLDVFSSDAVPFHMLTLEAMQLYLEKLEGDGVLLFHISSRLFDLEPVLQRLSSACGLKMAVKVGEPPSPPMLGIYESRWVALTRSPEALAQLQRRWHWQVSFAPLEPQKVWTDEYVNLFQALEVR